MQAGFIDGVCVSGTGAAHQVQSPSTEEELAHFPGLALGQVEAAISAARKAFDSGIWSGLASGERAAILQRFIAALASRKEAVLDTITAEAGCPRYSMSMQAQFAVPIGQAPEILSLFLSLPESEENPLPLAHRITPMGTVIQSHRRFTPIGVVAAIAAYNFPFLTALWKLMPALITGNTVVLRPSPLTPISAMVFAEAAIEAELPPGVLNIVIEPGLEGAQLLTTHPAVDFVAFTGSTRVGVQVMAQAAPTMKRIQLELGGKSAQIFLPDSVERAAATAAGICTAMPARAVHWARGFSCRNNARPKFWSKSAASSETSASAARITRTRS